MAVSKWFTVLVNYFLFPFALFVLFEQLWKLALQSDSSFVTTFWRDIPIDAKDSPAAYIFAVIVIGLWGILRYRDEKRKKKIEEARDERFNAKIDALANNLDTLISELKAGREGRRQDKQDKF